MTTSQIKLKELCRVEIPSSWVEGTKIEHPPSLRLRSKTGSIQDGEGVVEWHSSVSGRVSKPTLTWGIKWNPETHFLTHFEDEMGDFIVQKDSNILKLIEKAGIIVKFKAETPQ